MMLFFYFLVISLLAFLAMALDKFKAKRNKYRIPEAVLLGLALLGGTAGAILGMFIFKHKTRKKSFLMKFGIIILFQIITGSVLITKFPEILDLA